MRSHRSLTLFFMTDNYCSSRTMIRSWVVSFVPSFLPLSSSSGSILKVGYLENTLSYHLVFFAWKYLRVSLFENERFMKIRSCRPALPTYRQTNQPKMKKWVNFGNFWPIHLQFGMQVPFTHPHVTVTFGNDPTIFSPTNPTYQKVAYSKTFNLP